MLEELAARVERLATRPRPRTWPAGLTVHRSTGAGHPAEGHTRPTLALTVRGAKQTVLGRRTFEYRAGQYLMATLDLPVTGRVLEADPYLGIGLALRPELVAELSVAGGPLPRRGPVHALAVGDADGALLDAVVRLLRLTESPADFAVLAAAAEREVHWRLLSGPLGPTVRQVARLDQRVAVVGRAVRRITERFDEVVRVDDLAAHVGVSAPTLNRYFRAVTDLTPLQFQKRLRLQRARVRLATTTDDVASVGHSVGYESASQFSREYRRLFGVPPSRDTLDPLR